jgi:hypothetical protein
MSTVEDDNPIWGRAVRGRWNAEIRFWRQGVIVPSLRSPLHPCESSGEVLR